MTNKLIEAMARAMADSRIEFRRSNDAALAREGLRPNPHAEPPLDRQARAILKAISDTGYAVVPREPTRRQLEAAEHVPPLFTPSDTYRAMINATTTEEI